MTLETLTLTAFLLARIAEDEAAARAATPGAWEAGERCVWSVRGPDPYVVTDGSSGDGGAFAPENAEHIARHDPVRVLAECEAKRRIVEAHESWPVFVEARPTFSAEDDGDPLTIRMRMAQEIAWLTEQEYRAKFGDEPPTAPMLLALAAVYADHPDYRDEWRP